MSLRIAQGLICRSAKDKVPDYFDGIVKRFGHIDDYGEARNEVIRKAENENYNWIVFLDVDEELQPEGAALIRKYIDAGITGCFALPRIEFVRDREHYDDTYYPDWQLRIFKLGIGYHYEGNIHESLHKGTEAVDPVHLLRCPIYHYGKCMPKEFLALKYMNYDKMKNGEELLKELPPNFNLDKSMFWRREIPFIK